MIGKITAKAMDQDRTSDVYIVAKDFSWTYVRTHEEEIPLAVQIITSNNQIMSYQVDYFHSPEEYENWDMKAFLQLLFCLVRKQLES